MRIKIQPPNCLSFPKTYSFVAVYTDTDNSRSWPTSRPADDSVVYNCVLGESERVSKRGMCGASFHCAHQAGRTLTFGMGAVVTVSASKYLTAVVDYNACVYIVPAYHLSKVEFGFNEESNNVLLRDAVPCLTISS